MHDIQGVKFVSGGGAEVRGAPAAPCLGKLTVLTFICNLFNPLGP